MNVLSCVEDSCWLAGEVRSGRQSAKETTTAALDRIGRLDPALNCFTAVLREAAMAQAAVVDQCIAGGGDPGPLAGVPFAVKNLFDIAGLTTVAGSKIHAEKPPAARDATVVQRLKEAGAILLGAL